LLSYPNVPDDGSYRLSLSDRSSGAPVPDEPTNSFFPFLNVRSRPLALMPPSLARNPWTVISVPAGREFFVKPRRIRALGFPVSTSQLSILPSGFFTSRWIHAWGLIHSILVTVPLSVIGWAESNSAANE